MEEAEEEAETSIVGHRGIQDRHLRDVGLLRRDVISTAMYQEVEVVAGQMTSDAVDLLAQCLAPRPVLPLHCPNEDVLTTTDLLADHAARLALPALGLVPVRHLLAEGKEEAGTTGHPDLVMIEHDPLYPPKDRAHVLLEDIEGVPPPLPLAAQHLQDIADVEIGLAQSPGQDRSQ